MAIQVIYLAPSFENGTSVLLLVGYIVDKEIKDCIIKESRYK